MVTGARQPYLLYLAGEKRVVLGAVPTKSEVDACPNTLGDHYAERTTDSTAFTRLTRFGKPCRAKVFFKNFGSQGRIAFSLCSICRAIKESLHIG